MNLILKNYFPIKMRQWMCVCSIVFNFCDPMDYSLPGSSVHGIFQAGILEWIAISSFRGSSHPRIEPACIFCIGKWILYHWVTWKGDRHERWRILKNAIMWGKWESQIVSVEGGLNHSPCTFSPAAHSPFHQYFCCFSLRREQDKKCLGALVRMFGS